MTEYHKMPVRCLREERLEDDGFDVSELLDHIYQEALKQPWDRTIGVFHPSAMNGCKRSLYYDVIGEKPERTTTTWDMALFDLGHAIHDKLQARYETIEGFSAEDVLSFPPLSLEGSSDGLFKVQDWVLEIKSIGDASFSRLTKPKLMHIWQIHCYMWMADIPRAQLLYVNRNNGRRRVFKVLFSYEIWQEILNVINTVEEYVEFGEPPPQEINKWACKNCKFKKICNPEI